MKLVKKYLDEIKVPYTEEQFNGMTVLKLNYGKNLLAIFLSMSTRMTRLLKIIRYFYKTPLAF